MNQQTSNNYLKILAIITIANIIVLFIRDIILDNKIYDFLIWNLFLGSLPFFVAWALHRFYGKLNKILLWGGSFIWFLFYPNAPYMISDLIHINEHSKVVQYDALIIFSFAMLSLYYGFLSLKLMHQVFKELSSQRMANFMITFSLLLSSFGYYLGRVIRFNSWDLFTEPFKVIATAFEHLWPISKNPSTYIVIFLFTGIQYMLLSMMKNVNDIDVSSDDFPDHSQVSS